MNNQKATKAPKAPGKKPFSSRTVIGVICIILALLITFGVAPLVNRFTDQKVDIVRLKTDVQRGQIITADHLEIVNVGSYNLPNNVIKDGKAVVGKYAATDLYAGDYLFSSKLSTDNKSADDVLLGLGGEKVAISVNVANFAAGLSDKLENGDIVSVIIYDKDMYTSYTPAELKYVKVITTTTSDGVDKDEIVEGGKAATVTLLVMRYGRRTRTKSRHSLCSVTCPLRRAMAVSMCMMTFGTSLWRRESRLMRSNLSTTRIPTRRKKNSLQKYAEVKSACYWAVPLRWEPGRTYSRD